MEGCPKQIYQYVSDFCKTISNATPIYLDITPNNDGEIDECFSNVKSMITQQGGSQVYGWEIAEWYGIMIEAIFHSVWMDQSGIMHDVTPRGDPNQTRSLFLQDSSIVYNGYQINNIRYPLIDNKHLNEFIAIRNTLFDMDNAGERATLHEIHISDDELRSRGALMMRAIHLMTIIDASDPGRNELCRCGSGNKYKKCCLLRKG